MLRNNQLNTWMMGLGQPIAQIHANGRAKRSLKRAKIYTIRSVAPQKQFWPPTAKRLFSVPRHGPTVCQPIMEGLSVAASVRNSMSLDVVCAESAMKRNKVWGSIRGVSRHIEAVSSDLKVLSSALTQIACQKHNTGLYDLNNYCIKFETLIALFEEVKSGYAPEGLRVCKRIDQKPSLKAIGWRNLGMF